MVAPVGFHNTALIVAVPRSNPVGEAAIRSPLIPPLRRHVEIPVSPEELLAAATKSRIGVEDLTGVILEEDAVAGKVLQRTIRVFIVVEGAARRDLFWLEGDVEVVVEIRVVRRNPGETPTHPLADG